MPRYHLNLYNDEDVMDEEGTELPDLAAAKDQAIFAARELMAEHVKSGRPINLSHRIDIVGEDDRLLASIPFRELVTVIDR